MRARAALLHCCLLALAFPAIGYAQAPGAGSGTLGTRQESIEAPRPDLQESTRRMDPGGPGRPMNIRLQGEGIMLPQGADSQLIVAPPSQGAENAPKEATEARKPVPGDR